MRRAWFAYPRSGATSTTLSLSRSTIERRYCTSRLRAESSSPGMLKNPWICI